MPFTLVSFHAHPDDEALLTGGTLARAAAEGHRVVLVTATDGASGLAAARFGEQGEALAGTRTAELEAAAAALGVTGMIRLGYNDSGLDGTAGGQNAFCRIDIDQAAERLAAICRAEDADVLTGYDPAGGYGHPDHIRVHQVARRAAAQAATPVLLEATVDRDLLQRALRLAARLRLLPAEVDPTSFDRAYTARAGLTHRVDVRDHLDAKRAALRAHASQASADTSDLRTIGALLRLPPPLARWVLGREWFVEVGRPAGPTMLDDVFAGLR